ncbi:hypothetical protein LINPERHAP1_LOCUS29143 [Linum perenne]
MEESEAKGKITPADSKCPGNLDFNLPLLSTRRHARCNDVVGTDQEHPSSCTATNSINLPSASHRSRDHHYQVPFCWERAPGKPKRPPPDIGADEFYTPRLRLPPCRWIPAAEENDAVFTHSPATHVDTRHEEEDGSDADVDDDVDDYYSNAYMDALSLTEAIDIAQRDDTKDGGGDRDVGGFGRKLDGERNTYNNGDGEYLSFMMERFLPDATALAVASSAVYATNKIMPPKSPPSNGYNSPNRSTTTTSVIAQKGCGLDALFSWRGTSRHKLCNAKTIERQVVLRPNVVGKPQRRSDAKDTKRHYSGDKVCLDDVSRHIVNRK